MISINLLHKEFESRVLLGIMSVLIINDWVDFSEMKNTLEITDGNLASYSSALERARFIEIKKEFVGKKPKTSYRVTQTGRIAFQEHLSALEQLITKR